MASNSEWTRRRLLTVIASAPVLPLAGTCLLRPRLARAATLPIVMIVHRDNPHPVDRSFVQQIYTGQLRGWPDGTPVFALDDADGRALREAFLRQVIGRSAASMKAIWSQNVFTGKAYPPRQAAGEDMKRLVAANPHALGYLRLADADDSVRSIRI